MAMKNKNIKVNRRIQSAVNPYTRAFDARATRDTLRPKTHS